MNIFSNLPFLNRGSDVDGEPTEEELKKERIEFHRTKVRNGPAGFRSLSNGQIARARVRDMKRQQRKAFRAEVKDYFEKQRVAASIRAHLQGAGYLPYFDGHEPTLHQRIVSTGWIVQRFGTEVTVDGEGTGRVSFRKGDILDAFKNAAKFYTSATGAYIQAPSDFTPAFSTDEAGDVIEGAA